jgi:GxxExxY protein
LVGLRTETAFGLDVAIVAQKGAKMINDDLTGSIIDCAIEVHRELGPGLLENTYRLCLCHELSRRSVPVLVESRMKLKYKDHVIDNAYRADLIVGGEAIVEIKHVEKTSCGP